MFFSLEGKIAVVSGTAQGVGLSIAKRFIEANAEKVIMIDINGELGAKEAAALGHKADFRRVDVSNEEDVKALMDYVKETYKRIDILSNNVGIIMSDVTFDELTIEECHKVMNVNYFGYLLMMKYALPLMPDKTAICNIASLAGMAAFPGYTSYNASKGAVILLTKSAALELADRGIRVNCISPASISGPMVLQPGCEAELAVAKYLPPLGRLCEPEEVAALVHFLVSDDCQFITATNVPIDGGVTGCCYGRNAERKWLEGLEL